MIEHDSGLPIIIRGSGSAKSFSSVSESESSWSRSSVSGCRIGFLRDSDSVSDSSQIRTGVSSASESESSRSRSSSGVIPPSESIGSRPSESSSSVEAGGPCSCCLPGTTRNSFTVKVTGVKNKGCDDCGSWWGAQIWTCTQVGNSGCAWMSDTKVMRCGDFDVTWKVGFQLLCPGTGTTTIIAQIIGVGDIHAFGTRSIAGNQINCATQIPGTILMTGNAFPLCNFGDGTFWSNFTIS